MKANGGRRSSKDAQRWVVPPFSGQREGPVDFVSPNRLAAYERGVCSARSVFENDVEGVDDLERVGWLARVEGR